MDILYISDNGYFNLMRLSIISALKFNKGVTFHIFTMDCPETNQTQISKRNKLKIEEEIKSVDAASSIIFYDVRNFYLEKLSESPNNYSEYTPFAALRLLAPYIIENVKILLYLDCDTLVCGSLKELFERFDDVEFDFAALPAMDDGKFKMFLTTSLLFNLDYQRKTNYKFMDETIEIYNNNKFTYPDQEAITMAPNKMYIFLTSDYNMKHYEENLTKILNLSYRQINEVKNYLQLVFNFDSKRIFEKMDKIINDVSKIQLSYPF